MSNPLICAECGATISPEDKFCEGCGEDISSERAIRIKATEPDLKWTDSLEEAVRLNWLAQCKRRLTLPVDFTEDTGLSAFEYAWKVFNSLYKPFEVDPNTKHKLPAKPAMNKCLDAYLDKRAFLDSARPLMVRLCDDIIATRVGLLVERGEVAYSLDFDEGLAPKPTGVLERAIEKCEALQQVLLENDENGAPQLLVEILYSLRNARVHADTDMGSTQMERKTGRTTRGGWILGFTNILPENSMELCLHLLSGKTKQSRADLDAIIEDRRRQLIRQIVTRVTSWDWHE